MESHTDPVVSWDTVGGIGALVCPQGPPQADFGAKKKALLAPARAFGGRAYLGGAGQKDFEKIRKNRKSEKNRFFSQNFFSGFFSRIFFEKKIEKKIRL